MTAPGAARFYLPPHVCSGPVLTLPPGEAHHAAHVLRLRPGDPAVVLDGAGREFICAVEDTGREALRLAVTQVRAHPAPACRVTLLQALPKAKLIEAIIEKATELGAARVVPLLSERVVVRLDAQDRVRKASRWQQTAISALKQCGTPWLPTVELPISPEEFVLRREPLDLQLVAALLPSSTHAGKPFDRFAALNGRKPASVAVWVGPEGDFTPAEYRLILDAGAHPVSLGSLVLRCETAATACLSIVNHELAR